MKNIHVLPTDKPSRLYQLNNDILRLDRINSKGTACKNIYITSDEEIKEGDWYFHNQINYLKVANSNVIPMGSKKIILTTDQDLIKDGIQAIDDEFLEWFVNNPSCEEVNVNNLCYGYLDGFADAGYKIIIPKEELSKDEIDNFFVDMICNPKQELERGITITNVDKQETLGEAALKYSSELQYFGKESGFRAGAKWQMKRSYSEEEVYDLIDKRDIFWTRYKNTYSQDYILTKDWFEQFKKK